MFVVWGRCSSDASTPLWPIRRIICELAKHGLIDGIAMDAVGARTRGADSFAGLSEHRLGKLLTGAGQLLRVSPDVVVEQADA